jgi:hypothetical protein
MTKGFCGDGISSEIYIYIFRPFPVYEKNTTSTVSGKKNTQQVTGNAAESLFSRYKSQLYKCILYIYMQ